MNEIIELYRHGGFILLMTTAAAGRVGPSHERFHPNRVKLLEKIGLVSDKVYFVGQHHSRKVVHTDEWIASPLSEADGLISADSGDVLGITVADCMPVYLFDEKKGVRALLHSGWKGTGIALEAVKMMKAGYGSSAGDITAVIGPSIGSCCYNVDRERANLFSEMWGPEASQYREGSYYLSLRDANMNMLKNAGIERIIDRNECTACSGPYGSFRREGPENFTQMMVLSYSNSQFGST